MSIKHFFRCLFRVLILIIVHFLKPVVGPGICGAGKYMNSNGVSAQTVQPFGHVMQAIMK